MQNVRGDLEYVLTNTTPDFVMRPEVLTRLGEVELLLANPSRARDAFAKARETKPDYWPAYFHWARFLKRNGNAAEARELLKAGLEYAPTSKAMIDEYRSLGGDPAKIEPKTPPKKDGPERAAPADAEAEPASPGGSAQSPLPPAAAGTSGAVDAAAEAAPVR